jgi:tetratricopeptide (TPR) repeat protein
LCQRLTEADAGFSVHFLTAERGLAERIEQVLLSAPKPVQELLFVFSGYAVVSDDRGPALLLDGPRLSALSLRRVRRLLSQASPSSLVVLDTINAFDPRGPSDIVHLLNEVLMGGQAGVHVLAANRPTHDGIDGPSPFMSLLALVLDWHSSTTGLSPEHLFAAMRAEEALFAQIPFAELFRAPTGFQVLTPQGPPVPSLPPPATHPPPVDDSETRADSLVAAGDLAAALVEYGKALAHLGPTITDRQPRIYLKVASTLRAVGREADALAYFEAALEHEPNNTHALQGAAELQIAAGDGATALAFLERWLAADPNALNAAEMAATLLAQARRWDKLAALYEMVLTRVSDARVAVEVALTLHGLCKDELGDPARARAPMEHAARLAPNDPRVRLLLQELGEAQGDFSQALAHVRAALRADPGHVASYRSALRLFERCAFPDGAWNAACVLEALGEADINESLLAGAHKPEGLLPARGALIEDDWKNRLLCPERDAKVDEIFSQLGSAVLEIGLETARRQRRLVALDDSTLQDPTKSTATVAKTLLWAAKLLGVWVPKLYVVPESSSAFAAPPTREPTLIVSKSMGSGLDLAELAFLWSRQLTFLRSEHRAFSLFPEVGELTDLLLAALSIGGSEQVPFRKLDGDTKLFARGLKRHLSKDSIAKLQTLTPAFPVTEAKARVQGWALSVQRAAGRAGLLASGNVEVAVNLTRRFPLGGLIQVEDQVKDLMAYSVSGEYASLRERLGVLVQS